jgi:hypothetical protein
MEKVAHNRKKYIRLMKFNMLLCLGVADNKKIREVLRVSGSQPHACNPSTWESEEGGS